MYIANKKYYIKNTNSTSFIVLKLIWFILLFSESINKSVKNMNGSVSGSNQCPSDCNFKE